MSDEKSNPLLDGIPYDIDLYLNEQVHHKIMSEVQNSPANYVNHYVSDREQKVLDILIRRRNFERQGKRYDFESITDFREYVVDVWVNQIGYSRESFPGFVKACQHLGIEYYRD